MAMLLLFSLLIATLQHDGHGAAAQPAMLAQGLGRLHHPVATKNLEAQKFVDQGLIFVDAFNDKAAIRSWRDVVAATATDRLAYNEPPDWYYPTRESLGAALLRTGQHAEADRVFRDD